MRVKADERTFEGMTYGVELEYTGASRGKIARAIAALVGGVAVYEGSHLDNWVVTMPDGRKWQVESDASVHGSERGGDRGGEVVSPVLKIEDMGLLQEVVRVMRRNGARTDESCGGHVHVGAKDLNAYQLRNLCRLFYKNEELIYKMARVRAARLGRWCRGMDRNFIDKICDMEEPTMEKINAEWFWRDGHGEYLPTHYHYTGCRYRALNLSNLWDDHDYRRRVHKAKGTVEFRFFEGCGHTSDDGKLHAGVLKANVLLALLLVKKARDAKNGSIKNRYEYDETKAKYYARVFLQNLGMIGDFTKNAREHFMGHLGGSSRTTWTGASRPVEAVAA